MVVNEIVTLPHPILRKKAVKVSNFDEDFQDLVNDMIVLMREAPGVGLAAPQVAKAIRLVTVEYGDEEENQPKKLFVVANPEIIKKSEELVNGIEGCLSVPGLIGDVDRHESIVIKGQNRFGKPVKINAEGWLARIFQHEIDHLDGIIFTDRANEVWKPTETEEQSLQDV